MFKTLGYLVSTVSVVLLGVVSWKSAQDQPLLFACLVGGMAASVAGMCLRWIAFKKEQAKVRQAEREARSAKSHTATTAKSGGLARDVPTDATTWEPQHEPW